MSANILFVPKAGIRIESPVTKRRLFKLGIGRKACLLVYQEGIYIIRILNYAHFNNLLHSFSST